MTDIEYIKLSNDLEFPDVGGRYTTLMRGVYGIVLNEAIIEKLIDITEKQKKRCLELLEYARNGSGCFALVAGYPCVLRQKDYERTDAPMTAIVPGCIIGGGYACS